jgi:hypothetical protein
MCQSDLAAKHLGRSDLTGKLRELAEITQIWQNIASKHWEWARETPRMGWRNANPTKYGG